ncbi:MAG: magnesium protoporphyrin IX methyltransferase [Leptolyngbyaceae cyanobacterium CSU_1_3]|nr:magnesium protoporphyrin IX methyltransferase [Leptolyngbyaceae cyanobacterium CSU_1_3]
MNVVDDKAVVREYFNQTGFDRWRRIYGDGEVSKIQLDIRTGHQQTVDTVLEWLTTDKQHGSELTICDAGCGVGSLSIPLAQTGAKVFASDISEMMVGEAKERASTLDLSGNPTFAVQDLEELSGKYHTVICLDVLIHYPPAQAIEMIEHLGSLANDRLILSFAPKTFLLTILKRIGEFFPGPSKTTRAYQHPEAGIVQVLERSGFKIQRTAMTSTRFYFSRILEAVRG